MSITFGDNKNIIGPAEVKFWSTSVLPSISIDDGVFRRCSLVALAKVLDRFCGIERFLALLFRCICRSFGLFQWNRMLWWLWNGVLGGLEQRLKWPDGAKLPLDRRLGCPDGAKLALERRVVALERRFGRPDGTKLVLERHFGRPDGAKLALEQRFGLPNGAQLALERRFGRHERTGKRDSQQIAKTSIFHLFFYVFRTFDISLGRQVGPRTAFKVARWRQVATGSASWVP